MDGRDMKATIVRAGLPIYQVAAEAGIHPVRMSKLLNNRERMTERDRERITGAIERLSEPLPAGA